MTSTPSKATAGPWKRISHGHIVDANGKDVRFRSMTTLCSGSEEAIAQAEANTNLAAAAPDLLAALKSIRLLVFGTYSADHAALNDVLEGRDAEVLKQVDAAISRATGEA